MDKHIELLKEQRSVLDEASKIESAMLERKSPFTEAETKRIGECLARSAEIDAVVAQSGKIAEARAAADKHADEIRQKAGISKDAPSLSAIEERELDTQFNLLQTLQSLSLGRKLDGIALELHQEGVQEMKRSTTDYSEVGRSLVLPRRVAVRAKKAEQQTRDILADGDPTKGGYTIPTEIRGFLDTLENQLVFRNLGATYLGGLSGNLELPRAVTGADSDWLSETGQVTEGSPTVQSISLTPRRLAKYIDVSNKFLAQTSIDASMFIQNYLSRKMAVTWEKASIGGTGANGQPRGIFNLETNTYGTDSSAGKASLVSFSAGNPTRQLMINMRQAVSKKNAFGMNMNYLSTYDLQGYMLATPMIGTTFPIFMLSDDNKFAGTNMAFTNSVSNAFTSGATTGLSGLVYAAFEYAIMAQWGGVELLADQITQFGVGKTRIHAATYVDFGVQLPDAFAIATDVKTV